MSLTFSALQLDEHGVPHEGRQPKAVSAGTKWYPYPEDVTIQPWKSMAIEVALELETTTEPLHRIGGDANRDIPRLGCLMTRDTPIIPNCVVNGSNPSIATLGLWNPTASTQTLLKGSLVLFVVPETLRS